MREGGRDKGKEVRGRKVKERSEGRQKEVSKQNRASYMCFVLGKKRFHFCIIQGGIDICLSSQNFPTHLECVATCTYLCIFPNSIWKSGQGD